MHKSMVRKTKRTLRLKSDFTAKVTKSFLKQELFEIARPFFLGLSPFEPQKFKNPHEKFRCNRAFK